jgi:fido (protein-threonine AMPylation protein)
MGTTEHRGGLLWLARQRQLRPLEEDWLRRLHREMFGQTWRWAGHYRCSDKTIGADWRQIRMQVRALLGDVTFQMEHRVAEADVIAVGFHHRLVAIHPFPNGNGRQHA